MSVLLLLLVTAVPVAAETMRATLDGYQEVPIGAISTSASGELRGRISQDAMSITYELTYSGLEGLVTQAHIHLAREHVNGGIVAFLCQTATISDPSGFASICPQEGTVTGVLTAANVIGPTAQGIAPGEFEELVAAIRAGATYANVHSTKFPGGEIRGQIRASHRQ